MIVSRFGVMFFDDSVRAFANLRTAATDDAEVRFVAWRSAAENPFMTTAERAAAPLLPNLPARRPGAPGQFAFADRRRVYRILEESGWTEIDIRPVVRLLKDQPDGTEPGEIADQLLLRQPQRNALRPRAYLSGS